MNLKNILEKFFKGLTVLETVESRFNGRIKVDEDLFGHKRLVVGNLAQSGGDVYKIWKRTINELTDYRITNCLILGLGAGNAGKIVNKYFPDAKITGIEIDPEIIKLGRKYFGLGGIKNLKVVIADAVSSVIHNSLFVIHHDLVLVDLYLGDVFPEEAEETKFLESLKKILNPKGVVVFNRLYYGKNIKKTDDFEKILQQNFDKIEAKKIDYNKVFLCRK